MYIHHGKHRSTSLEITVGHHLRVSVFWAWFSTFWLKIMLKIHSPAGDIRWLFQVLEATYCTYRLGQYILGSCCKKNATLNFYGNKCFEILYMPDKRIRQTWLKINIFEFTMFELEISHKRGFHITEYNNLCHATFHTTVAQTTSSQHQMKFSNLGLKRKAQWVVRVVLKTK